LLVTSVAGLAVTSARANCPTPKFFGSVETIHPYYYTVLYFHRTATAANDPEVMGHFWQTGNSSAGNEQGYPSANWFYGYPGLDYWYIYGNTFSGNHGCPQGNLTVYLEDRITDNFMLLTVMEGPGPSGEFDFDFGANIPMYYFYAAPSPRPRITDLSRIDSTVTVEFMVHDPTPGVIALGAAGLEGHVTALHVYTTSSAEEPDLYVLAGGWTLATVFGPTGGTDTLVIDCGDPAMEQWLATGVVVEGESPYFVGEPIPVCGCRDVDEDGFNECANDCDDRNGAVYPGAPQLCDGVNNDCDHPNWPGLETTNEFDDDGDTYSECQGDCDDTDDSRYPGAPETCNGVDDDCDNLVDEDALGEDTDGDGVHNLCDNCPAEHNPYQGDTEDDGVGDACDNCRFDRNPTQCDWDNDLEGDHCDFDDGLLYILFDSPNWVEWQDDAGFDPVNPWNCYRGDMDELRATGVYTQDPGAVDLARRDCGLSNPWMNDTDPIPVGKCVYDLTTGISGGVEGSLGQDSGPGERPNDNPCP
jgi:hypothetical protein